MNRTNRKLKVIQARNRIRRAIRRNAEMQRLGIRGFAAVSSADKATAARGAAR